jgi:hypothetical protein
MTPLAAGWFNKNFPKVRMERSLGGLPEELATRLRELLENPEG